MADTKKTDAPEKDTHSVGIETHVADKLRTAAKDRMVGMGWLASRLLNHALDELPPPGDLFHRTEANDAPDA